MTDGEAASIRGPQPRRVRWRYRAGAILSLLFIALFGVWLARAPIAKHFIDDALRARHVPASYRIERIGFRTQRLTDVRIGDPAHPDLVADWVEVDTSLWTSGATLSAVRTGHVRMQARLADGKVSFGAIDRLLPASSGMPFALPAIDAEIADARIALMTPHGAVSLAVTGAGRLDDGFAGTLGASAPRLDFAGCRIDRVAAALKVRIVQARPSLAGPVSSSTVACGGAQFSRIRADLAVAISAQLDHWKGSAGLGVAALAVPGAHVRALSGPIAFVGSANDVSGTIGLRARQFAAANVVGASSAIDGRYRYAAGGLAFVGHARSTRINVPHSLFARLSPLRGVGVGTPIGPIVAQVTSALEAAGSSSDIAADVAAIAEHARGQISVSRLAVVSASGARGTMTGGSGVTYRWPGGGVRVDGDASVAGGGLPTMRARVRQASAGAAMTGRVTMAPYNAGPASLALAPVDFSVSPAGVLRVATRASLSGPVGDGRIEAVSLPLAATWDGVARLLVNPGCVPLAFERLRVSGLDVPRSAMTLCPRGGALLWMDQGVVRGGGKIGPVRLGGTLGDSSIVATARGAEWSLGDATFAVSGLGVRLGTVERLTRLDVATLDGTFASGARGTFAGAGGQIGHVPLLLSAADGQWRFASGVLALDGALAVADAAKDPRFKPLAARAVALTLANSRIAARGTLFEPAHGVKVADVAIVHDLRMGSGSADLTVPGIAFGERFQPDLLTPLTYGLIANVAGSVSGEGHIRWTAQGVTSDGVFRTPGIDLAAAFGPATGIAGELRFTDLLALETAPGQIATVKTLNPGVPVNDGTIRYRLLSGARIAVEQGRWPFAGGTLTLEPTLLDFGAAQERRVTFRVSGMQAGLFLQQFDFKNLAATGVFDGKLPMIFDANGGRIADGHLVVRADGEGGGGTIAYVGELSQKDIGLWGNFAFQALKSLRYRNLDIVMNGPLAGEIVTEVRFAGVGQGVGAKRNFILNRLQKLPLVFNVRIKAPFRQLIDTAQSFYDPKRLIERNLPALLEDRDKRAAPPAVQPPDSRIVP